MINYNSFEEKKSYYNPNTWKIINTSIELDTAIAELKVLKQSTKTHALFRGVCEAKYKLYTSLQRECFTKNITKSPLDIVREFLKQGRTYKNNNILPSYFDKLGIPLNDWMLLAMLQHYGAPSPLLDFTKDYIPALYFMCLGLKHGYSTNPIDQFCSIIYFKGVDACAHVLENLPKTGLSIYNTTIPRPKSYKEKNKFILEELSFEKIMNGRTLELIPSYKGVTKIANGNYTWILDLPISNMNMASQEGEFICNISATEPLENLMNSGNIKYLHCINIHKSLADYIIEKYLGGSLEEARKKLFPTEYQAVQDIYFHTMASLF